MLTLCPDSSILNTFLGIFDLNLAPTLLYYSYLPIIFVSLFFGLFIIFKDRLPLKNKIFFALILSFVFWVIDAVVTWISIYAEPVHFGWELIAIFEFLIYSLSIYFSYVFLNQRDLSFKHKTALFASFLPILVLLPTVFNMESFDLANCQSNNGLLWNYIYILEIVSIFVILGICLDKYRNKNSDSDSKKQAVFLGVGTILFLGIFTFTNIAGDSTLLYEINLIGPLGMVLFIAFLGYMIVKFKAFNIKLLATQALVASLWFLVFAILFIRQVEHIRLVVIVTLVFLAILGWQLVKSVKREVSLREELEIANVNQQSLIHFITHQVKGFFTKSRNIFSMILEGEYGQISLEAKSAAEEGFRSDTKGVDTVQEILRASNLKKGTVAYESKKIDLKEIVNGIFEIEKKEAESKGLQISFEAKDDKCEIDGDLEQLKHAFKNIVDNSVKYTLAGNIWLKLKKNSDKITFSVKDTGVGISENDFRNLFKEGGRGKDSVKVNVDSTGYGLFIVKGIVDAHGGRIWAESEGEGKGSTFFIELPVKK